MKRFILALLLLLLICISVSAENTGRSWFYDGDSIFYFNLDNDTELPLPTYETRYDSEGYKKGKNILSNAGCENTDHIIKYTVRCENYFVSQSDTMKKRPVSIAIIPRVNAGGDTNYCADPRDGAVQPQLTDYVQNTANENFEASFYSPKTNGTVYYHNTDDGKQGYISRFWIDLIIVMPVLTDVERASLITADDYLLNITVTWTCNEPGCDDEDHCGFVSFYIRGAYNTAVPQDTAYMFVEQLPEASALNLTEMTTLQGKLTPTIADMDIYTVFKIFSNQNRKWANFLTIYMSSGDGREFKLTADDGTTIPYVINVVDRNTGVLNATFDGTDYYGKKGIHKIDFTNYQQDIPNRQSDTANSVYFPGEVQIEIPDSFITGVQDWTDYETAGAYTSTVYYNIVYETSYVPQK